MIALCSFTVSGLACWLHYNLIGATIVAPIRVWHVWIFCTMCGAAIDVARREERELWLAWGVLFLSWVGGLLPWAFSTYPIFDLALKNLIVMCLLLIVAIRPETLVPTLLHGVIVMCAFLAAHGVIPSSAQRPKVFLAWSHPDISTALQHVSFIFLGGYGIARRMALGRGGSSGYLDHNESIPCVARETRD